MLLSDLGTGAWIAIGIAVALVVGAGAFSVYWFFLRSKGHKTDSDTMTTTAKTDPVLGTIRIQANTKLHPTVSRFLAPQEALIIKYEGPAWKDVEKEYMLKYTNGTLDLIRKTRINQVAFTLPDRIFADDLSFVIRVGDKTLESTQFEVDFQLKGTSPKGSLIAHQAAQFTVVATPMIMSKATPILEQSTDNGKNWTAVTSTSFNAVTHVFTYTPGEVATNEYLRVRTTTLIKNGYPRELTFVYPGFDVMPSAPPHVSVSGTIATLTAEDIHGAALPVHSSPSDLIRLVWTTTGELDLTRIFVKWSPSPTSGFVNLVSNPLPALDGYTVVSLPSRTTLAGAEAIYLQVVDADTPANAAVSQLIRLSEPTLQYLSQVQGGQSFPAFTTSFPDTSFYVPVYAPHVTAQDDFFNSANWTYRITSKTDNSCGTLLANTGETGVVDYAFETISINFSNTKDIYLVTFLCKEKLPYFNAGCALLKQHNGFPVDYAALNVSLGFVPWQGKSRVLSNPQNIEVTKSASQEEILKSQDWGDAIMEFEVQPGVWASLKDRVFQQADRPNLTVRYTGAKNITLAVVWELHHSGQVINLGSLVPHDATMAQLTFALPDYVYDTCTVKCRLDSGDLRSVVSPSFVISLSLALNHVYDAIPTPETIDKNVGDAIDLRVYGKAYALRDAIHDPTKTKKVVVQYKLGSFPGTFEQDGDDWLHIDQTGQFAYSLTLSAHGSLHLRVEPNNFFFGKVIRFRMVAEGISGTLPDIVIQPTVVAWQVTTLPYDADLKFQLKDYHLEDVHIANHMPTPDSNKLIVDSDPKLRFNGLTYEDGQWSHSMFIQGGEYGDTPMAIAETYLSWDNHSVIVNHMGITHRTVGQEYRFTMKLKQDPNIIKFGPPFTWVYGMTAAYKKPLHAATYAISVAIYTSPGFQRSSGRFEFALTYRGSGWGNHKDKSIPRNAYVLSSPAVHDLTYTIPIYFRSKDVPSDPPATGVNMEGRVSAYAADVVQHHKHVVAEYGDYAESQFDMISPFEVYEGPDDKRIECKISVSGENVIPVIVTGNYRKDFVFAQMPHGALDRQWAYATYTGIGQTRQILGVYHTKPFGGTSEKRYGNPLGVLWHPVYKCIYNGLERLESDKYTPAQSTDVVLRGPLVPTKALVLTHYDPDYGAAEQNWSYANTSLELHHCNMFGHDCEHDFPETGPRIQNPLTGPDAGKYLDLRCPANSVHMQPYTPDEFQDETPIMVYVPQQGDDRVRITVVDGWIGPFFVEKLTTSLFQPYSYRKFLRSITARRVYADHNSANQYGGVRWDQRDGTHDINSQPGPQTPLTTATVAAWRYGDAVLLKRKPPAQGVACAQGPTIPLINQQQI